MGEEASDTDRIAEIRRIFFDAGYEVVMGETLSGDGRIEAVTVPLAPRGDFLALSISGLGATQREAAEALLAAWRSSA